MAINHFKRFFFKSYTFIFIAYLTLIGLASYYFTNQEKVEWEKLLNSPDGNLNTVALGEAVKEYGSGLKYFFKFLYSGDLYMLYTISIFVIMGVFLSAELLKQKNEGIGAYCVTRKNYRAFLRDCSLGMVLYMTSVILSSMCILVIVSHFVGGFQIGVYTFGIHKLGFAQQLLTAGSHILILIVYTSLAMVISSMVSMFFHNMFFARIFPAAVFVVIPQVLGGTLANVFLKVGTILCDFIPVRVISNMVTYYTALNAEIEVIAQTLIAFLVLAVILLVVYKLNVNRFSKDYL